MSAYTCLTSGCEWGRHTAVVWSPPATHDLLCAPITRSGQSTWCPEPGSCHSSQSLTHTESQTHWDRRTLWIVIMNLYRQSAPCPLFTSTLLCITKINSSPAYLSTSAGPTQALGELPIHHQRDLILLLLCAQSVNQRLNPSIFLDTI